MASDQDEEMTQMASTRPTRRRVASTPSQSKPSKPKSTSKSPKADKPEFSQVGRGKNAVSFQDWIKKLNRVVPFLGDLSYKAQMLAANGIVAYIRLKLSEGIDPSPSPMTISLRRGDFQPKTENQARRDSGAALATLGDHLVVDRPPQKRVGMRKAKNGQPGSPGKFAKGFGPANIRFESEHWDKIAYTLEHGRIWKPPERVRKALIMKASIQGFTLEEGTDTSGYWILPPRPFMHLFTGPEAQKILRDIANAAVKGQLKKETAAWREEYVDAMQRRSSKTIEDISDIIASESEDAEDWTELIEFSPWKRR